MRKITSALTMTMLLAVSLLAGCGSIPLASRQADLQAKSSTARPDKARIYVYRDETIGFAVPMTLALDGRAAGRTAGQTYLMWDVEPGAHAIASYAEDTATLTLQTEPGKSYYVWQEVKIGFWKARSRLHAVDEIPGRKAVVGCDLGELAEAPQKTALRGAL